MSVTRAVGAMIPDAHFSVVETDDQFSDSGETLARFIRQFLDEGRVEPVSAAASSSGFATILFTDMASSTSLADQLGDAAAQEVRRAHNDIVRAALMGNAGNEIKHTGDGIMASFSTASSALDAAIAIQRGVAQHRDANPDSPLAVYVGLNAGEPIAEDEDLFGTSVDLAARLVDHAEPGQIIASDVVRQLAAGKDFLFADLGETELRGFEDPVKLWGATLAGRLGPGHQRRHLLRSLFSAVSRSAPVSLNYHPDRAAIALRHVSSRGARRKPWPADSPRRRRETQW